MDTLPDVLTVKEAAQFLGLTAGGLRGAVLRGKLPSHKDDAGKILLHTDDVASLCFYGAVYPREKMTSTQRHMLREILVTLNETSPQAD